VCVRASAYNRLADTAGQLTNYTFVQPNPATAAGTAHLIFHNWAAVKTRPGLGDAASVSRCR